MEERNEKFLSISNNFSTEIDLYTDFSKTTWSKKSSKDQDQVSKHIYLQTIEWNYSLEYIRDHCTPRNLVNLVSPLRSFLFQNYSPAILEAVGFCRRSSATWQRRRPGSLLNGCISCEGRRRGIWAIPRSMPGSRFSLASEAKASARASRTSGCACCDCCSTPAVSSASDKMAD